MKRERILVFQPLFIGTEFDYRMLGLAHWVTAQLGEIGLEGASAFFIKPPTDGASAGELIGSTPPSDPQIRQTLVANASRYGLVTSFAALSGVPHLAAARLFEARRGHPLRTLARWTFDGDTNAFPAAAHSLFVLVGSRLGAEFREHAWSDLFGTSDSVLASNFLTALGCYASCDRGVPIDDPKCALDAALSGVARGLPCAVQLLPPLVEALRTSGSADREMLAAAVEAAVDVVGVVPQGWHGMMRDVGIAGGVLN